MFEIDHLILGAPGLDSGVQSFQERSGVKPVFGGEHPAFGTHNALASLGQGVYLEVIARRPGAELQGRWRALLGLEELAPIGWAVRVTDLAGAADLLQEAGFKLTGATPGSRVQPDGALLQWMIADIVSPEMPQAPFLIEWSDTSPHPSSTTPGGCRLESIKILEPNPEPLQRLVEAMNLDVLIEPASARRMILTIERQGRPVVFGAE